MITQDLVSHSKSATISIFNGAKMTITRSPKVISVECLLLVLPVANGSYGFIVFG